MNRDFLGEFLEFNRKEIPMARKVHVENGVIFAERSLGLLVMGFVNEDDTRTRLRLPKTLLVVQNGTFHRWYVTDIDKQAFANNQYLEVVALPTSIRFIKPDAFKNCQNLQAIVPADFDRADSISIAKGAFQDCPDLELVDFGRPISYLYSDAFSGCTKLTKFKSPVLDVAKNAFKDCKLEQLRCGDDCSLHEASIDNSGVQELFFLGRLKYATSKTLRWIKTSGVKISCTAKSPISELVYEGIKVEVKN